MNELYILRHGIAVEPGTPGDPGRRAAADGQGPEADAPDRAAACDGWTSSWTGSSPAPCPGRCATAEIVAGTLEAADRLETADVLRPARTRGRSATGCASGPRAG